LEFRNVDFCGGRKIRESGGKPLWKGRESTNNSTHMKYPSRGYESYVSSQENMLAVITL
jgi:hypothetical protein